MYKSLLRQFSTESITVDLLIVGAGPAGLSAAIRAKQIDPNLQVSEIADGQVTVIEKAAELGGHTVSGICFEPRALDELIPDWRKDPTFPLRTEATKDSFYILTGSESSWRVPILPRSLHNHGNRLGSLSEMVRWLGEKAMSLGVDIFTGFGAAELLERDGRVMGIVTNELGRAKDGREKSGYTPGMSLEAKITLLAEGAHGSLSKKAIKKFNLRSQSQHQTYGLGLKEVWELNDPSKHQPGSVIHTVGWPLDAGTYGGSFMYHYHGPSDEPLVSLGFVIGLDYKNPYLNPYREFQRLKLHPLFRDTLEAGRCLTYAARALNEGGYQSIPRLDFPGGALIGCAAGFLNVPKIKGTHTAMKSGMISAEAAVEVFRGERHDLSDLTERITKGSWIGSELWSVRNVRPSFHAGLWTGLAYTALDQMVLQGKAPWTLQHGAPDYACLEPAAKHQPVEYPKADGQITFELLESVSRTGTGHEEDQPSHLQLKDPKIQVEHNLPIFAGPEQRFCPAGVYEYVEDEAGQTRFQINASNCIHCKTCDIKDPSQNINWQVPEGGGGPKYSNT